MIDKIGFSIPLGLAYLSSVLKANGFEVDIFSAEKGLDASINTIQRYQPHIIGYSVITGTQKKYLGVNKILKDKLKFYSVFGGPHPTFFPQIIEREGVDVVCRGEAEDAFLDLVKFVDRYKELPEDIANLWVRKGEKVFKNQLRHLKDNLDALPYPDHKIFLHKFPHLNILKRREFIAHRGCPYTCSYCFNSVYTR